ncbi:hypothetical protein PISMIDRAFT_97008, partial [Pisolithus microcarpus 441]
PAGLSMDQNLRSSEILKIFMVGDHINRGGRALKVVLPMVEGLENCQKLLVMGVIIEFGSSKCVAVESDGVKLAIRAIGGIGFDSDWHIGNPMGEYGSRGEGIFEVDEGRVAFLRKIPSHIFLGEAGQWHNYLRIVMDESSIEVCKPKEGLNVLDFLWFGPITDGLNLVSRHSQTRGREDVAKVLD